MKAVTKQAVAASSVGIIRNAEPANVETVVCASDPLAEILPEGSALALLESSSHVYDCEGVNVNSSYVCDEQGFR